ncbi:MAG: tetratricopeptide repeat protein [Chitinophagales bacterium]|nr:tetratricopeptide repeat protein [Chitinophagales bacterium]MDW8428181.1 tetratricopeptide repeat protein [Chitinophagales bacterium]
MKVGSRFLVAALTTFLLFGSWAITHCGKQPHQRPYRNLSDTAYYVGMQACRGCHEDIYQTFIRTGMGQSWGAATPSKSAARLTGHEAVYDSFKNFWYRPFWLGDRMYIEEYRLRGTDTLYRRREQVTFIVGSGQHTNSHLWWHQGYLCQAPITYYTQKGVWDLAPGFEGGRNSRWQRAINMECMTCHNMYPQARVGAENAYLSIGTGIECERCHGPGSIHVAEKLKGLRADTLKAPDYSIVNPRRLPRELQMQVCMRCHLQGITVLKPGKRFTDFKPGMYLNEVMEVFMPRYAGDPPRFIMASHVDRLKQSRCYQQSQMTCLTCHNPHVSVTVTPKEHFNNACKSCHGVKHTCTLPLMQRQAVGDHCYSCHMPVSETLDIPHVTVHDHRIQVPQARKEKEQVAQFLRLECLTSQNPSPLLMAQGYLQAYEAFEQKPFLLDSAAYYLSRVKKKDQHYFETGVRLAFLRQQFDQVLDYAARLDPHTISAWTAYRIGESYYQKKNYEQASAFFGRAVLHDSLDVHFLNKYGSSLMAQQRLGEAEQVFRRIVALYDRYAPGWNNLGYVWLQRNNHAQARECFRRALELDPDYEQAWLNLAALEWTLGDRQAARQHLQQVLRLNPHNAQALAAMRQIGG